MSHADVSTCAPCSANLSRHSASCFESGRTCAYVFVPRTQSWRTTSRPTNPVAPRTNAVISTQLREARLHARLERFDDGRILDVDDRLGVVLLVEHRVFCLGRYAERFADALEVGDEAAIEQRDDRPGD